MRHITAASLLLGGFALALSPPARACQVHGVSASCVCAAPAAVQAETRTVRRYSVVVPVPVQAPDPVALLAPAKVAPQQVYPQQAAPLPSAQSFQPQPQTFAAPAPSAQYQQQSYQQTYQYQEAAPVPQFAPATAYVEEDVPVVVRRYAYGTMLAAADDGGCATAYSVMPTGYGVGACNQGVGFRSNGFRNNGFRSNGFQSSGFNSFSSGAVATGGGRVVISGRRVNLKKAQVQGLFNSGNDVEITGRRINFKKGIFN